MEGTLYLDASSGISGDMTVAALLDLGAEQGVLLEALKSLPLQGFEVHIKQVQRGGVAARDFDVRLTREQHEHRHLSDITDILDRSGISAPAKTLAKKIFVILAEAEAEAHGCAAEHVHFHEVGAVDSIVDIVGAAVCIDNLNITRVICTPLTDGRGHVSCCHGLIPVPVPAVVNIARRYSIPLHITDVETELVTPTGAAIAAAITHQFERPSEFIIRKTGIGAGKREYSRPNVLRAFLIEEKIGAAILLECNIDDQTGEGLGYAMEALLNAGALDCWFEPIYMKKGRPAVKLCVICAQKQEAEMAEMFFRHTSTIGIRRQALDRVVMERHTQEIDTPFGKASVKLCSYNGIHKRVPEYEDVRRIARQEGMTLADAERAILGSIL